MSLTQVVKSNGTTELFDEKKLIRSLEKSKASVEEIEYILSTIIAKLRPNITTADLYLLAYKTLNDMQKHNPNAVRYSLKRSVMNLGPTGFPFERFVARLFQEMGYQCVTGVTLQGHCIVHEIDIFAHNEQDVICIEAKFHNESHLKSDTKVALYVKARFDDLIGQTIVHENVSYKISKGILVTNTTFTKTAHNYVDCIDTFQLLSWNDPKEQNLLHYIEKYNVYPITVVPGLSKKEIEYFLFQGILTCTDLKKDVSILEKMKIRKSRQETIKSLLNHICNC